ncbi:uncharacterized protein BO96DRAFT_439471 [Aspergillus niger CBS 101883]|uniref:uncharacterized protein n=1 Tax=Aspergillus lacticoffeatus (strain CBS 101883) TaxID=1450533 RepID=UPI000D800D58|nr:uncharacterized protein BO96DRAFT_439471 [Aspergillus niger CBS 101883]PYH50953.1 hypothetical protein BO96DRAFT_439471 [Aspergillus niger CBS 101883]
MSEALCNRGFPCLPAVREGADATCPMGHEPETVEFRSFVVDAILPCALDTALAFNTSGVDIPIPGHRMSVNVRVVVVVDADNARSVAVPAHVNSKAPASREKGTVTDWGVRAGRQ